jgi:hypothetical protein
MYFSNVLKAIFLLTSLVRLCKSRNCNPGSVVLAEDKEQ